MKLKPAEMQSRMSDAGNFQVAIFTAILVTVVCSTIYWIGHA